MIYFLGDSFFFGWNFFQQKLPNRKELLFSHLLSNRLNLNYKNLSLVGSSNYRLCRLVNYLDIKKEDIVILGWTACDRLEFGVPADKLMPNDVIINYADVDSLDHLSHTKVMQVVEKTDGIYTRSVYPTLINHLDEITSPSAKKLTEVFYHYASDRFYHEQMFKILFNSAIYKLRTVNCKFLMFTTWDVDLKNTEFLNIPEYLFYQTNMLDEIRYKNSEIKHKRQKDFNYFTVEEHQKVAEILYEHLS